MKTENEALLKGKGSIGGVTFVTVEGMTIAKQKVGRRPENEALSLTQRLTQARYATCMNAYHVMSPLLKRTLLKTKPMQRANGLFLQCNSHDLEAVLTKKEADAKASLLCHFVVSHGDGSLPPVEVATEGGNHVFSIELGDLQIGPDTTINQFGYAVMTNSPGFYPGDALTLVACRQELATGTVPFRFSVRHHTLVVDSLPLERGDRRLGDLLGDLRLLSVPHGVGHRLATPAEEGVLVALIHSRMLGNGTVVSSDQRLHGRNPLLDGRTSPQAWAETARTYGRVKPHSTLSLSPTPLPPPSSLEDYFG